MAVTLVASYISTPNKSSGASTSATVTASVGDVLIAEINTRADSSTVESHATSVTDSSGNTWTQKVFNKSLQQGVYHELTVYTTTVTTALSSGTVTFTPVTFNAEFKAMIVRRYTGLSETVRATTQTTSATGSSFTLTHPGPQAGDLVLGIFGWNGHDTGGSEFTGDTDTVNGSWSTALANGTSGKSSTSNGGLRSQQKIVSATGSQTWDPTIQSLPHWGNLVVFEPATSAEPKDETGTANAFGSTASLSSTCSVQAPASASLSASVSESASGTRDASTESDSLGTSAALSGTGSAAASATAPLDTDAGITATGSGAASASSDFDVVTDFDVTGGISAASDATAISADVTLVSSGVKGVSSDASTLASDVGVASTGAAAVDATTLLVTEASVAASGNADASAVSELPVETSLNSEGSASGSSNTLLDFDIVLGPANSGTAFFAAVSELSGLLDVSTSGTADSFTSAEALSAEASSNSTPWVELVSAASIYEALALFNATAETEAWTSADNFSLTFDLGPADSFLSAGSSTIFSTTVELDADSAAAYAGGAGELRLSSDFPAASTESGPTASAEPLTFSVAVTPVANADTFEDAPFQTILDLESSSPTLSARSDAPLQVESEYGTATITGTLGSGVLVKLSVTRTAIPDTAMDTEIDFLDMETLLPSTAIATVIGDPRILTEVPDTGAATSIDDPLMDTEIDFLDVDTVIDDPTMSTEIPSPGITTSANGA